MKRSYYVLFVLIPVVVLSCKRSQKYDSWREATEYKLIDPTNWELVEGNTYSIKYPSDWTSLGSFDQAETVLLPPSTMEEITSTRLRLDLTDCFLSCRLNASATTLAFPG